MKRLKFLPSILMLVLSIAVLGLGVYAANPGTNNVTGTIKVNAAGNEVEITGYVEENYVREEVFATKTSRGGIDITFGELLFDESVVNDVSEVPYKTLIIKIQNKSSKALGAYFYNGTDNFNTFKNAADEDVKVVTYAGLMETSGMIVEDNDTEDTEDDVDIASYVASPYAYIAAENDENTYDCVEMRIRLNLARLHDDSYTLNFNFALNIEEYIADETGSGILKISDSKESLATDGYWCPSAPTLVIPSSISTIADNTFWEYQTVEDIFIPGNLTEFKCAWFSYGIGAIEHITFPANITKISMGYWGGTTPFKTITILGENVDVSEFFVDNGDGKFYHSELKHVYYRAANAEGAKDTYTFVDGVLTVTSVTSTVAETASWAGLKCIINEIVWNCEPTVLPVSAIPMSSYKNGEVVIPASVKEIASGTIPTGSADFGYIKTIVLSKGLTLTSEYTLPTTFNTPSSLHVLTWYTTPTFDEGTEVTKIATTTYTKETTYYCKGVLI